MSLRVEERVKHVDMELSELDMAIARKRKELRVLEQERERKVQHRKALRQIVSPLRRLPPELVSEILILSVTTYNSVFHLSQICSAWRQTALSTQRLWTRMPMKDFCGLGIIPVTKYWLERSGDRHPLHIELSSMVPVAEVIDLLVSKSHHCQTIDLEMPNFKLFEPLFRAPARWDLLESVALKTLAGTESMPVPEGISPDLWPASPKLECAPRLTSISLDVRCGAIISVMQLPLGQLTDLWLNVESLYTKDYIEILAECPKLVTCTLHLSCELDVQWTGNVVEVPLLQSLTISESYDGNKQDSLFAKLRLPSLSKYDLLGDSPDSYGRACFPVDAFLAET